MIGKHKVLQALRPNSAYALIDDAVVWHDEVQSEPTAEEISAKEAELQAEYDANEYQRDRKQEYPSIGDQLDDIYHNGIDGWKATIKVTKDKYPKS